MLAVVLSSLSYLFGSHGSVRLRAFIAAVKLGPTEMLLRRSKMLVYAFGGKPSSREVLTTNTMSKVVAKRTEEEAFQPHDPVEFHGSLRMLVVLSPVILIKNPRVTGVSHG